ncbi:MAG: DUF2298 domain-containing protein [Rhizobacter sp.]
MNLIFLITSLALLWLHLAGVTVFLGRWLPYPLARSAGVLGVVLVMCLVEHGVGLGMLGWAWPLTALAAGAVVYRHRSAVRASDFLRAELVFLVAVGFGLAWKWMFPTIYPTNERYTDLYFMLNYFPGDKLPPLDIWFPPLKFNFYYAFQHYGAALMGRLFNWDPGTTYNIAFSLLMGLSITLIWFFIGRFLSRTWAKCLLLAAVATGGTGISAYYPLLNDGGNRASDAVAGDELFANARFIGYFDQQVNTKIGKALFPPLQASDKPTPGFEPRIVAMENFGYQYPTSDYHPPVGGFFLLFLGLAALAWVEVPQSDASVPAARQRHRWGQALFALTVPVVLITNAWVFPLAVLLLGTWVTWRMRRREPPEWSAVLGGLGAGLLLIYPFLNGMAAEALVTPIRWVQPQDHTPPWRFVAYFWPLLVLLVLSVFERRARPLALMFALAFGLATLAGELLYVDDHAGETLRRYNTTAKWYGWIWSGGLLACGAMALSSGTKWVRTLAAVSLLLTASYAIPIGRYLWNAPKYDVGVFNGLPGEMRNPPVRQMLKYLKQSPRGIVAESTVGDGYSSQTMVAMFSGQIALQGWPVLIGNWRHQPARCGKPMPKPKPSTVANWPTN